MIQLQLRENTERDQTQKWLYAPQKDNTVGALIEYLQQFDPKMTVCSVGERFSLVSVYVGHDN